MKHFEFQELSDEEKKVLLSAFNYSVDKEGRIRDALLDEPIRSEIDNKPLTLSTAALVPGSLKIIDADPVSLSKYLRENVDSNDA